MPCLPAICKITLRAGEFSLFCDCEPRHLVSPMVLLTHRCVVRFRIQIDGHTASWRIQSLGGGRLWLSSDSPLWFTQSLADLVRKNLAFE